MTNPSAAEVCTAIDDCRRLVMAMYGGNLDHPALNHLEAAMVAVWAIDSTTESCHHPHWQCRGDGSTFCTRCGADTTQMEAMGG